MKRRGEAPPADDATADALWESYVKTRDDSLRRRLFDRYLPLAHRLAAQQFGKRVDDISEFDDYYHFGTVGLLEALDRFDPTQGVGFETFATYRVRGAILNGVQKASERNELGSYRSRRAKERVKSLQAREAGDPPADVFREMVDLTMELAIGFFLQDDAAEKTQSTAADIDPYACEAISELRNDVAALIETLPEREQMILRYHYFRQLTFQQIAELLGLSKGRVSQLHRHALKSIRARCGPGGGIDSYL